MIINFLFSLVYSRLKSLFLLFLFLYLCLKSSLTFMLFMSVEELIMTINTLNFQVWTFHKTMIIHVLRQYTQSTSLTTGLEYIFAGYKMIYGLTMNINLVAVISWASEGEFFHQNSNDSIHLFCFYWLLTFAAFWTRFFMFSPVWYTCITY